MEKETMNHVEEERLEAYAMNALDQDEIPALEEHLLFCDTCQDQLEGVERYLVAMKSAAARISKEEEAEVAVPGVWDRIRAWVRIPTPVWSGGLVALAAVIMAVGLQVQQRPGPAINVELTAVRGATAGTAQAGHALNLRLNNLGLQDSPQWRVEIVDSEGGKVWDGTGTWSTNSVTVMVAKSFKPGTFFVRLLKQGEEPIREFKLVIE